MHYNAIIQDQILRQFEPLIHYTLHRGGLRQSQATYEDYAQELRVRLLFLADDFGPSLLKAPGRYRFTAYAKQALFHRLVDLLRQNTQPTQPTADLTIFEGEGYIDNNGANDFLSAAKAHLSAKDWAFMQQVIASDNWSTLAKELGISRQALHKKRQKLSRQLAELRPILKD